ncbi:hypothetical protein HG531_005464 [Fusarium graminearum]|nr:hypothetical protein HG531_005464 [Fusarium graminearum]
MAPMKAPPEVTEVTNEDSRYDARIIAKEHTTNGSSDGDEPGELARLGLLDGVEVVDVDLLDRVWRVAVLKMLKMSFCIFLDGHDEDFE